MDTSVFWQIAGIARSKATAFPVAVILIIFAAFAYYALYCSWVLRKGYALSFRSMASAFLLGVWSCLFLAWPLERSSPWPEGFREELYGGAIEELAKFVAVLAVISCQPSFRLPVFGLIYGILLPSKCR